MKRTQRLSIEFQHREVTITVEGSTLRVQENEPDAANTSTVCRTCNSPWIDITARAEGDVPASMDSIRYTLQQFGLHVQVSSAGQLRICKKSFEGCKEKF